MASAREPPRILAVCTGVFVVVSQSRWGDADESVTHALLAASVFRNAIIVEAFASIRRRRRLAQLDAFLSSERPPSLGGRSSKVWVHATVLVPALGTVRDVFLRDLVRLARRDPSRSAGEPFAPLRITYGPRSPCP